jgi:hypothetical protein
MSAFAPTVLVCGGRDYDNQALVDETLDALCETVTVALLVNGGATGADRCASAWAVKRGVSLQMFHANWVTEGNRAGPLRNERMLKEAEPDLVIAFPGGRGTAHMVCIARAAGVRVIEVPA